MRVIRQDNDAHHEAQDGQRKVSRLSLVPLVAALEGQIARFLACLTAAVESVVLRICNS